MEAQPMSQTEADRLQALVEEQMGVRRAGCLVWALVIAMVLAAL